MCVPIQRVHRDSTGLLTHVGGSTLDGVPWGLTIPEAVALQESRMFDFFVEVPTGEMVGVLVKLSPAGHKYLTTSPDGVVANNLDSLPNLPDPLAGVEPPFPLNIPSPITTGLMKVTSIGYSGRDSNSDTLGFWGYYNSQLPAAPKLTSLTTTALLPGPTTEFERPGSFWTATPRSFYLDAIVPFPAEIIVSENGLSLERVPGDSPARRWALEAAGKGWWTLQYVLTNPDGTIDPTKPTRLTEVKVVIRPGSNVWSQKTVGLSLSAFSVNPYCYRHAPGVTFGSSLQGSGVAFRLKKAAVVAPQPPATATMPSVVGKRLAEAFTTIYGLGFKSIYNIGPVAMSTDLNVDSQSPAGGTANVKLTEAVILSTSLVGVQRGIKKIVVSNQSNRAKPLDLWLFDYATGQWDKDSTVAYQGQKDVDLEDGHTFLLAAVDSTLLNCQANSPEDVSCVYSAPQRTFTGDSAGVDVPFQIT
jgi:hypothetical protein